MTIWAKEVSQANAHPEYPRPGMVREDWLNLNGQWDFDITFRNQTNATSWTHKIIVPFPAESILNVSRRIISEQQRLWYRRKFSVPPTWDGRRILLHFEAVDWETEVSVNGQKQGNHRGSYDEFSFDITDVLKAKGEQEVVISVSDPSEAGFEPRGKQMFHPRPPFFSAASGVWQTVWLEPVASNSIDSLKIVPDIDGSAVKLEVKARGQTNGILVEAFALDGEKEVARTMAPVGQTLQLAIPNAKLWSPDTPFLYNLKVALLRDSQKVDEVGGYFGMRKISVAKDESGFPQLMLNNQRLFQLGPLDQGYWPDGIYTAPTDDALRNDIEVMKRLGFNMCRKHVKIEPERWYYWCDKLGLLVWQDMPNGDRAAGAKEKEIQRKPESSAQFELELRRMMVGRGNHPCIVMWIAFNQGWGQYDTARITSMIKELDPSRLVLGASGWNDMGGGDVRSLHQYPGPARPEHDGKRACVLGECGALGLAVPGHLWGGQGHWNTAYLQTPDELTQRYSLLISQIQRLAETNGLSGAVITELTDVETELDGFMTYDREVMKTPEAKVREINERVINAVVQSAKK